MRYTKEDRYIDYQYVPGNWSAITYAIKGKTVWLDVPVKCGQKEIHAYLDRHFEFFHRMIHDRQYRKFYGKKVVHYLGKPYFPKIKKSDRDEVIIKRDTLILYCREDTHSQHQVIYRRFLKTTVEQVVSRCYYDAQHAFPEIDMPPIVVKGLLSQRCHGMNDGSCIYLGRELGRYEEKYIRAVLYHELCHCLIREHNEAFYRLLDEKLEDGRRLDREIDGIAYFDVF